MATSPGKCSDLEKSGDTKSKPENSPGHSQPSSVSAFYQYGINNSETLPMNQSFGLRLTGFGLVTQRPKDSMGAGMSMAWLNSNIFDHSHQSSMQLLQEVAGD